MFKVEKTLDNLTAVSII